MKLALTLLCLFSMAYAQSGMPGFDMPSTTVLSASQFTCMANQGMSVFIGQLYSADGEFDQIGIQNMNNAKNAGVWVNAYITPCRNADMYCKNGLMNGTAQANAVIQHMNQNGMNGFIWVNVGQNWGNDQKGNQQFLLDITNTIKNSMVNGAPGGAGIFTNYNFWKTNFGASFTGASDMDLWWNNWNGKQDITTGWTPFGGWQAPCYHQYAGNVKTNSCANGTAINLDYLTQCSCQDQVCFKKRYVY